MREEGKRNGGGFESRFVCQSVLVGVLEEISETCRLPLLF